MKVSPSRSVSNAVVRNCTCDKNTSSIHSALAFNVCVCVTELASIYHGDTVCRISQDLPNHNWLENKLRISPDGDGSAGGGATPSTPTSPTKTSEPPPNKDKGDKGTFSSLNVLSLQPDRRGEGGHPA